MKCSRLICLFLALLLAWLPCAVAEEGSMFSYLPLEGVTCVMQGETADLPAPEGLEPLYAFFGRQDPNATVCIFRMPNGRVLASVSCTELAEPVTIDELYALREQIADGLADAMAGELVVQQGFRREEVCGQPAMVLDAVLKGDGSTGYTAKATLFCRGSDLFEIWTAHPSALSYVFAPDADKELKSDLAALEALLDGFDFGDPYTEGDAQTEPAQPAVEQLQLEPADTALPHMTITADDGTFRIDAPLDTAVIHAGTDADTVARTRALFAERTGGGECFDEWYKDVAEENCWLLVSREYGLAVQITTDESVGFRMSSAQLAQLEEPVLEAIQERFDYASVGDETAAIQLDGKDHVWFTYKIGKGGMELLTYVLTAADGTGMYEMDIYLCCENDKSSDELSEMVILMMNSLDYLPDAQL